MILDWKTYVLRSDIRNLPLEEQRRQFLKEQLYYDNLLSEQRQLQYQLYQIQSQGGRTLNPNPFLNTRSLSFDSVDDYVDLGSGSTVANGGQFTLSFWINGSAASSGGQTYLFSADYYNLHNTWVLQSSNLQWMNINGVRGNLSIGVLDSNWHHILIVFNPTGADQTIRCFTDGANEVNVSTDYRYAASSTTYIGGLRYIGNRGGGSYNGLNGLIDEFAAWDSDESSNLSSIYNGGVPNNLNDLNNPPSTWLRMGDSDTFPTLTDNGSGGNNGTINGATIVEDVPS